LDAFTKVQLQESLLALRSAWKPTIVLVTHDIEEAVFLADRVVVMSARPGTIRRVIPIDLAHPRDRTSVAFSELRALVLRELNDGKSPAPATAGAATLAQVGTA
jgi:sulfonate transport system ATP-binding protein